MNYTKEFGLELYYSFTNLGYISKNQFVIDTLEKKTYKEILEILIIIFERFEEPISYYILGNCYYIKGAKYRLKAFEFYEKFLKNPIFFNSINEMEDLGIIYRNLGIILEKEYRFDESLKYYQRNLKNLKDYPSTYCHIANIFYKMGQIDNAINILKDAKKTIYYKKDKITFKSVIDNNIIKFMEKKEKNKIYKPRKK